MEPIPAESGVSRRKRLEASLTIGERVAGRQGLLPPLSSVSAAMNLQRYFRPD